MSSKISVCWKQYEGQPDEHFLIVRGVQVAVIQSNDEDEVGKPWTLYAYDSDFQDMYADKIGNTLPCCETVEKAKEIAESVFIEWIKAVFQIYIA